MMDEDDQLQVKLAEVERAVGAVRDAADLPAKKKEEKRARALLNDCRGMASKFRTSMLKLEDATQRSVFNRKYNVYDEKLKLADKELRNLITAPKPGAKKLVTHEEKKMDEIMGEGGRDGQNFDSAKSVLQAANRAQEDALKSLARSLRLGKTMEDQLGEMLETVRKQTEILYKIDEELQGLDSELDRAKADVQWFFRQMAGDRCCIGIMLFLVLGVCALIFWRIYSNRFPNAPFALTTTTTTTFAPGQAPTTTECIGC